MVGSRSYRIEGEVSAVSKQRMNSIEWTMPYGEDGDDVDLEIYVGVRGGDLDKWIDRMPTVADMTDMMRTLLVFIVLTASK